MILQGEALEQLKTLPDKSVNMCITSPPYWALRDYGVPGQLGLEPTFQEYIDRLCNIFDEVKRVLRDDGTCWVNIGDTYSNSGGSGKDQTKHISFGKVQTVNKYSAGTVPHRVKDLPDKCLVQIPFRFSIEMTNRNWILRNVIIWKKNSCMPSSVKDRFTVDFEYMFFFSKQKKYYFEQQLEDYESEPEKIRNKGTENFGKNALGNGSLACSEGERDWYNKGGRNKRCVWTINPKPFSEAHFAVYPEELIETPIKAGCPIGGTVLDPFFGSGTTGAVATKQNKKYIGIELNPEYIEIAKKRIYEAKTGITIKEQKHGQRGLFDDLNK